MACTSSNELLTLLLAHLPKMPNFRIWLDFTPGSFCDTSAYLRFSEVLPAMSDFEPIPSDQLSSSDVARTDIR